MVDFRINVVVDPRQVPQGTRVVERQLTRVENRADRLRQRLARTFSPASFGILAGGAAVVGAIRTIARFEEAIATVGAVTGATNGELERLNQTAQQLGITTRFSATQAANALTNLARAGFDVNEAIEAVDDTLNLAQAGNLGLAEASDIAAATIRGFRLEVDQATRVVDVLTATANNANTNVSQLGEGIKFVAPVAAGLGQSLETTNAALGVLSDAGLRATLAGTGLRRVLAELEAPSSSSQKILAELGLTADEVRVSQVGLVTALERLRDAGIDTGTALEFFGQRGGPAFEVLSSNIPRIQELEATLRNAGGTAETVARQIDDTLNGALLRARSALEGFVLSIGEAGTSDFLIGVLDGISTGLRFLAENAELVTAAVVGLAAALTSRLAAALLTSALPAIRSFALALVLARGNIIAVTASLVRLNAVALANPFVAIGVAVAAATVLLREQSKILEEIEQSFENLVEDANFAAIGTQIRQATQELRNLERAVAAQEERGFGASDSQLARIERLNNTIRELRGEARQQADAQREVAEAQAAQAVTVENLIGKLDREAEALRSVSRETEIRRQFEEELQRLLQAGQVPTADEREQIQNRLEQNAALRDQARILEEIRGPQEEFRRNEAALNSLLDRGSITLDEFNAKLSELRGEFDELGGDTDSSFQNGLEALRQQNELLGIRVNQGAFAAEATRLENQLRREGVEITREVQDEIANQLLRQRELNQTLEDRNEKEREGRRIAEERQRLEQQEQQRVQRLAEQINLAGQQEEAERRVNEAYAQRLITFDQAAQALADIQLRSLEASTSLEDGFARAFARISREAENLAAVGEAVVNVFADRATDALVEFATTGRFSFKEFANAILQDLTRIIARLLIVQALNAAFGGGAGTAAGAGASLAGARQEGGTVQPARSFVVGENGPELFVPDRTGTIVPNQADQPAAAAPVNVQVVNVQSEDEIPQAINDGAADEAIINAIARNKDRVNQVTQ